MTFRVYYNKCWIDIDSRNFKTIKELVDHLDSVSKLLNECPSCHGNYWVWAKEKDSDEEEMYPCPKCNPDNLKKWEATIL